jgi:branched-chain amino acid transport system ATP-binding protein
MLQVEELHDYYGGIHAVQGICFSVPQGKIVTLVGSNGAGKSSTLRAISGLIKVKSGTASMQGKAITGWQANRIVEMGIVLSPEGRRVFADFTVEENLLMGAYARKDTHAAVRKDMDYVFALFPRLEERIKQRAGNLSGGEQQMLALGRALMGKPRLLMLDEPSLGLAPIVCEQIFETIKTINEEGVTILLVEQNAKRALELSHFAYVLETGTIAIEGSGKTLLGDPRVQAAYLSE